MLRKILTVSTISNRFQRFWKAMVTMGKIGGGLAFFKGASRIGWLEKLLKRLRFELEIVSIKEGIFQWFKKIVEKKHCIKGRK